MKRLPDLSFPCAAIIVGCVSCSLVVSLSLIQKRVADQERALAAKPPSIRLIVVDPITP